MIFRRTRLRDASIVNALLHLRTRNVPATLARLSEYLAYDINSIRERLLRLREKGLVQHEANKKADWYVVESAYREYCLQESKEED